MEQNKKTNWFTRILLIAILLLITIMVIYRFFCIDPKAEISAGIIILIAFLIVLSLSEIFDNFSVGEILKLSKTIKSKEKEIEKKETEITKINTEKNEIINQIITLSNNFNQRQSNTSFIGFPPDLMKKFLVQEADDSEVDELKNEETQEVEKGEIPQRPRRIDLRRVEKLAIEKFLSSKKIDSSNIRREIKLTAFQGIDPISDSSPIFDAYLNDIDKEVFFEVKLSRGYSLLMFKDRLYSMLSKIYHYRTIKKITAYLTLIIVVSPDNNLDGEMQLNRIYDIFKPALSNDLLKIEVVNLNKNEMDELYI